MNKYRLIIMIGVLIGHVGLLSASEGNQNNIQFEHIIHRVVEPYVVSLKSGNIVSVKRLIAGNIYRRNRVLLEENSSYSEFLKNYYQDSIFTIKKIQAMTGHVRVEIEVQLPGRKPYVMGLRIENQCGETSNCEPVWRIVDEMVIAD